MVVMRSIQKHTSLLLLFVMLFLALPSCMTTKTSVGQYTEQPGESYTYAKGKQMWLFWGLVPIGRTNVNTPGEGDCEVVTRFNVADVLISTLTFGIVTTYTIKVKAKREEV